VKTFACIFKQQFQHLNIIMGAIAEGNLVVLHVHNTTSLQDRGSAMVDIFLVDVDGQIVEFWDVI
jgi:predicted SnoaL-like aldol condensation-catalyzing enzyme